MDFFCWACYINCIFKYYKIFVTDRYFSKLGLTVSDSDWNIYVMAPMQQGKMQGVGLGTWQKGSHTGFAAFLPCCTELPSQLSLCSVPSGSNGRAIMQRTLGQRFGQILPSSLLLSLKAQLFLLLALPCPAAEEAEAALPKGCSWVQGRGSGRVLLSRAAAPSSCPSLALLPEPP